MRRGCKNKKKKIGFNNNNYISAKIGAGDITTFLFLSIFYHNERQEKKNTIKQKKKLSIIFFYCCFFVVLY